MNVAQELLSEINRILEQYVALQDEVERVWAQQVLFTWHWWLAVALSVVPWVLWLIVRDKRATHRLLYAGFFTIVVSMLLDVWGTSNGLWHYNTWLIPLVPEYLPWDLSVMPVVCMLYYQFWPRITARLFHGRALRITGSPWIASLVFGATGAFIVEPIFMAIGVYETGSWSLHYSFPIYALIYLIGYWLYTRKAFSAPPPTGIRAGEPLDVNKKPAAYN